MPKEKLRQVNMRILQSTLDLIDEMKPHLHTENRTQIVASSIKTLHYLLDEISKGNKIILRNDKKGTEKDLNFIT